MEPTRFDTIVRLFANRRTATRVVQDATPAVSTFTVDPNDPHPSADSAQQKSEILFVQTFASGTWAPKGGGADVYSLTISGAVAQTTYFSDRPERIVGQVPTATLLEKLGFTPDNPPNAALVAGVGNGPPDTVIIELTNPVYDEAGSISYDARMLADYGEPALASLARQQVDGDFPASFRAGGLFIDDLDCPDIDGQCYQIINGEVNIVGDLAIGACTVNWVCTACNRDGRNSFYGKECASLYPETCHFDGTPGGSGWDCFARGGGI